MIDKAQKDQLTEVFTRLENPVELVLLSSEHEKQDELKGLLHSVAETSEQISTRLSDVKVDIPSFEIHTNGKWNGIRFRGVPGGHEFTSLILAILNSDGKGKFPDDAIQKRIKNLKGPVRVRTFVALSCETCPDVVQALNLMTTLHPDMEHEMVDGSLAKDEAESLGIQGVPAVMSGNTLVSSGKVEFGDLLSRLEKSFGPADSADSSEDQDLGDFDVTVIGAGPAGVSTAIYTARKGMKTVIIADRLGGQLQETKGIQNLISVPYTEGPELSSKLAKHMEDYDIQVLEYRRVKNIENAEPKVLHLETGEVMRSKAVVVATGAKWRKLNVPGEKDYMGQGVHFCPHCDGPYYKGKDVAVVGGGNSGVEAAIDLAGLVKSVTLLEFLPELKADEVLVKKLSSLPNVKIIKNARTTEVKGDDKKVTGLSFEDRGSGEVHNLELDGIFVQIGLVPNSEFVKDIVETNQYGEILIDGKCKTNVPGIYAAGDVTTVPFKQIIVSMGEGAKAGLTVFEDQML